MPPTRHTIACCGLMVGVSCRLVHHVIVPCTLVSLVCWSGLLFLVSSDLSLALSLSLSFFISRSTSVSGGPPGFAQDPMSAGGELGSPRTSVDMGIPMSVSASCASWVHPGSALTWEIPCQLGASWVHPGPALTWEFPCQLGRAGSTQDQALTWEFPCQSRRAGQAGSIQDQP